MRIISELGSRCSRRRPCGHTQWALPGQEKVNAPPFGQSQNLLAMIIRKSKRCEADCFHGPFLLAASSERAGRLYDCKPVPMALDVDRTEGCDAEFAARRVVFGGCHHKATRRRCCPPFPEAPQAFGEPYVVSRRVVHYRCQVALDDILELYRSVDDVAKPSRDLEMRRMSVLKVRSRYGKLSGRPDCARGTERDSPF